MGLGVEWSGKSGHEEKEDKDKEEEVAVVVAALANGPVPGISWSSKPRVAHWPAVGCTL